MKYAIMSDIHGNLEAFKRAVADAKKRKNRNMTQRKWVEVILQKLVARGIALALDELPRRYVSREFLTL